MRSQTMLSCFASAVLGVVVALSGCRRDTITDDNRNAPTQNTTTPTTGMGTNTTAGEVATTGGTGSADTRVRPYGGQVAANAFPEEVADRLANERCARETRCNNVGSGKRYSDQSACLADIRSKNRDELNSYDCRGGVNQKELDECLSEIRKEGCNNPLDTLGRLAACRSSDLCISTR